MKEKWTPVILKGEIKMFRFSLCHYPGMFIYTLTESAFLTGYWCSVYCCDICIFDITPIDVDVIWHHLVVKQYQYFIVLHHVFRTCFRFGAGFKVYGLLVTIILRIIPFSHTQSDKFNVVNYISLRCSGLCHNYTELTEKVRSTFLDSHGILKIIQ